MGLGGRRKEPPNVDDRECIECGEVYRQKRNESRCSDCRDAFVSDQLKRGVERDRTA